jgi:multimeric flavodoxin WrbA
MIRILGIAGSPVKGGNTEALLKEALEVTTSDPGIQIEILYLSGLKIEGCTHCNWCIKNQTPETFCALSDGMDEIYPALVRADAVILASPVHIGRLSGLMADMIDRMRVFVYGNAHRGKLTDKVGAALVVGFLRHGGLEMTLQILNHTFAIFGMIAVGRGGMALTSLDGKGRVTKGIRHMALEDGLGVLTAKGAVQRAAELARIIQAGKKALRNA